jgi:hypothetical protein
MFFELWISDFLRVSIFGFRFVLLKLHPKWLQFFSRPVIFGNLRGPGASTLELSPKA